MRESCLLFLQFVEGHEPCLEAGPVLFAVLADAVVEGIGDEIFQCDITGTHVENIREEFFRKFQVGIADGLAVYRDSQVLLVDDERNMVSFPVENLRLAIDVAIAGVGVDSAMDCGADELRVLLALDNLEAERIGTCGKDIDGLCGVAFLFNPETYGDAGIRIVV